MPRTEAAIRLPLRTSAAWRRSSIRPVGTGPDINLINRCTVHLPDRLDAVRLEAESHLWFEVGDIDIQHFGIFGIIIGHPFPVFRQSSIPAGKIHPQ